MTIQTELLTLQEKYDGILKPENVVEWAEKHPTSALYGSLEWDDGRAGHAFRLWQARHLISLTIINEEGERQTVALRIDRDSGGGYRSIDAVLRVPDLRDAMLAEALQDLERVRVKYASLKELARVWGALDEAQAKQSKKAKGKQKRKNNRGYREDRPSA